MVYPPMGRASGGDGQGRGLGGRLGGRGLGGRLGGRGLRHGLNGRVDIVGIINQTNSGGHFVGGVGGGEQLRDVPHAPMMLT